MALHSVSEIYIDVMMVWLTYVYMIWHERGDFMSCDWNCMYVECDCDLEVMEVHPMGE